VSDFQTPNFALDPADIPRVEEGLVPPSRITLQYMEPPAGLVPAPACDAHMTGTGIKPPPSILLDFMYGVAAYKRWCSSEGIDEVMWQRFADYFAGQYQSIPISPVPALSYGSNNGSDNDDPNSGDYGPNGRRRGKHHRPGMSDGMSRAMENMLALSMFMKGTNPQAMAAERQSREEEEERRAQEASRTKVEVWMRQSTVPCAQTWMPRCAMTQGWKASKKSVGMYALLRGCHDMNI
jgi:hypothetical protein